MFTTILFIFVTALIVQILYYIIVFSRFLLEKPSQISTTSNSKGVSIIVCAWNEFDNLTELLPLLANQNYHDYEVVIVDDRSSDGSGEYLKNEILNYPNFKLVTITETPDHLASKKYALSLGIKVASKEVLLMTDADCRPTSEYWIAGMLNQLGFEKQIVLGYSPYTGEAGFLNAFIRFETLFTAWQYFSYALLGLPYMGVGRNLMYRKKLFVEKLGFRNHQKITGGDDDLFVNENSNGRNTSISFHSNTFVFSEPKHSFADWKIQKRRHLSIGKRYKTRDKIMLGLYSLSHIMMWFLSPALFFVSQKYLYLIGSIFALRLLLFWIMGSITNYKLGKYNEWYALPIFDFLLAIYYFTMGWYSVIMNKKIKWK